MSNVRHDNSNVYIDIWNKTLRFDKNEYALYQLNSAFEIRISRDTDAILNYRFNGVPYKVSTVNGRQTNDICPYSWESLEYIRKTINEAGLCVNDILASYGIFLTPNWKEINKKWLAEVDRLEKIFGEALGNATQAALNNQVHKYQQAYSEELSKDFGLSFGILSSSLTSHLLYAAQSAAKEQKDHERAEHAAADAIKNSHADITSQIFATVYPIYVDSLEPAMKKLLSEYYAYIIAIFSKELHCSYDDVVEKFEFERSNGAIFHTSDNARANILEALQVFPNNGNVIGYAIKNDVLDDELCEYGKNASESFGLTLKKWAISALREIYKAGKLFNKPLVTNENSAIIEGLKQYYKAQQPNLDQCQDWQDIITTVFLEDISKHLIEFAEIAVAQASILIPEEFDKLAKSGKQFHLSNESKILFVCLYHDLAFEGAYTNASLLDLTVPFSVNDIDSKLLELNEKLNQRLLMLIKQDAEYKEAQRQAEIKKKEEKEKQQHLTKQRVKKKLLIATPIISITLAFLILLNTIIIPNSKYTDAIKLMEMGDYGKAISIFESIEDYKDSNDKIQICKITIDEINRQSELKALEQKYQEALSLIDNNELLKALSLLMTISDYKDSFNLIVALSDNFQKYIFAIGSQTHALDDNGNVISIGANTDHFSFTSNDIIKFSFGSWYRVGLTTDKTVVAVGNNHYGQCDVSDWHDITDIAVGFDHTVGLKSDGTVVAVGKNDYGQCNVNNWENITEIIADGNYTVGLTANGKVLITGYIDPYCPIETSSWSQITEIYSHYDSIIGLKSNGTVVATGLDGYNQLDVSSWNNIKSISMSNFHTIGLKHDGSVVAAGKNDKKQCDVQDWENIITISVGDAHTVGLKADGTVVATGLNDKGQCNVEDWTNIIAISTGYSHTIGLKSDGTVVATGSNDSGQCDVYGWNLFD